MRGNRTRIHAVRTRIPADRTIKGCLVLAFFLLLLAGLPGIARADGAISITRTGATYTFQKEAHFTLEATGAGDITKATLRFRIADQTATNTYEEAVQPARSITVNHTWSLAGSDMPSGTVVTYWWTVEDTARNTATSERRVFTYEDTRFTWKKLSRDDITLAWYSGGDTLGRDLLDTAVSAYQRLAAEYGVERKPASIYIYSSYPELQSGIGESAQEWTGGRAYPEYNVVLIGVPPSQLSFGKRALAHEFTHLIVHRATQNPFGDLPRWLDEGLAMWSEGSLDSDYRSAFNQAVKKNQLLSIRTLASNFPADPKQATLAYAESYNLIVFIRDTFGPQKIGDLLTAYKDGSSDDAALQRTIALTTDELDDRWRGSLGLTGDAQQAPLPGAERPLLALLLVVLVGGSLVVFVALVVVVGLLVRSKA